MQIEWKHFSRRKSGATLIYANESITAARKKLSAGNERTRRHGNWTGSNKIRVTESVTDIDTTLYLCLLLCGNVAFLRGKGVFNSIFGNGGTYSSYPHGVDPF